MFAMSQMKNTVDQDFSMLQCKVAAGDTRAFRQIFDALFSKLSKFSYSFVQSKEAATEIVDELFVRLWTNRINIEQINDLRVYLYTATKNASLNYIAKKAKQIETEPYENLNVQIADGVSPEQLMITKEILQKIKHAVEGLPPRCKLIFKLVREDGLRYAEVAEILSLSVKTIDAQMVIAVSRIRESVKSSIETTRNTIYIKK
jgi:RNA polymerase sigma-70 factor (ECF subfamily)